MASGSDDRTIKVWVPATGRALSSLEEHTDGVVCVSFSADDLLLASLSGGRDGSVRLWDTQTWQCLAVIPGLGAAWFPGLAFHPMRPVLASVGSDPGTPEWERGRLVYVWEIDLPALFDRSQASGVALPPVYHTTAKIVLVGDHSVGKSGLGYRLVHDQFKEQAATHGQQFWPFPKLRHAGVTAPSARPSCGTSPGSPTTVSSMHSSSTMPTWRCAL